MWVVLVRPSLKIPPCWHYPELAKDLLCFGR